MEGESPTLSHQTWTIYIGKDNTFQESFEQFERLALSSESFFNLTACSNYATTNYIEIPVIHLFEMVNKENFKMKCQLLKMARPRYIAILIKPQKDLELDSSLQH